MKTFEELDCTECDTHSCAHFQQLFKACIHLTYVQKIGGKIRKLQSFIPFSSFSMDNIKNERKKGFLAKELQIMLKFYKFLTSKREYRRFGLVSTVSRILTSVQLYLSRPNLTIDILLCISAIPRPRNVFS